MPDEIPPLPSDALAEGTPPGATPKPPVPVGAISTGPMNLPPIALDPVAAMKSAPPAPTITVKKDTEVKDTFRELIETVVFVVVLVLMLKTFLAEAFVIPTGSMADTLLGYHHKVVCKQCGYTNLVNASSEADPQDGIPQPVVSSVCGNCQFPHHHREVRGKGVQP